MKCPFCGKEFKNEIIVVKIDTSDLDKMIEEFRNLRCGPDLDTWVKDHLVKDRSSARKVIK